MLRVNGFYGHVRRNDLRSLGMFVGFAIALQMVAAVALFVPLFFLDFRHLPFFTLGYLQRYAPIVFVLGGALFLQRFLWHVAFVRASLDFVDVDRRTNPCLVNIVEATAIAAGLPAPKVGLIESSARNAFACGLGASSAVVVVTRGLLESLDDDELAAVVAHEIVHIKNGDIRLMAAANVLMEILLLVQQKNPLGRVGWKRALLFLVMPALLILFGAAGLFTRAAFTIARVSRLLISSSREFVADAEAVRLTHNPAALISALRLIEGRSTVAGLSPQADAMMIDGAVEGPFATHPTIAERIAVLTRLSGAMAHAGAPRRDTRAPAEPARAFGPWGRATAAPAVAAPARFLVQRVNAGVEENPIGLTPAAKRVLTVGFTLFVAIWGCGVVYALRTAPHRDAKPRGRVMEAARPMHDGPRAVGGPGDPLSPGSTLRAETQCLSALDPVAARCFPTERYQVGDRGLRRLGQPDPKLVAAFARGPADGPEDIAIERYLGLKERSLRAVTVAEAAELDTRLLAYVRTRKTMLWVVHRFLGDPGLHLLQTAYDSPADRSVNETIRQRLAGGSPALQADRKLAREMQLLISHPLDFVPCLARAEEAGRTARGGRTGAP